MDETIVIESVIETIDTTKAKQSNKKDEATAHYNHSKAKVSDRSGGHWSVWYKE
jgi:hypothetical protein